MMVRLREVASDNLAISFLPRRDTRCGQRA